MQSLPACCLLAALLSLSTAFLLPPPTFIANMPRSSPANIPRISPATLLNMGLFDRFARVAKANLNNVLKTLEDPEKIMTQAVEDMQNDLVNIRQSYAEVTASQRRLAKQKETAEKLAEEWYLRAQSALKAGDEELAKEALGRRQQQTDSVSGVDSQLEDQKASLDKLYEGMTALESRINESKNKKDQMVARARTAQSTKKVKDMLSGVTGKSSTDAFSRMEEKVEMMEAQADVASDSAQLTAGGGSLESRFKELEATSSVDDELAKMKQGILGGGASKALPGSVEDEVENLLESMEEE